MKRRLQLDPDHGHNALWWRSGNTGPVRPSSLGLSESLCLAIEEWILEYEGVTDDLTEEEFVAAGQVIANRLAVERPDLEIIFDTESL